MRRGLRAIGLDVRSPRSAHEAVQQLEAICRQGVKSPLDRRAATRLLSGLAKFVEAGHVPKGQLLQDAFVLGERAEPGFFVEVGSAHPIDLSNVACLVDSFGWSGVAIDPNPNFAALHKQFPRASVRFIETAVGEIDHSEMDLVVAGELSSRTDLIGGDGHAAERRSAMRSGQVVRVPVRRLDALLHELDVPNHIQYLSVDTEGAELEVLKTFPFTQIRVDALTIEHNFRAKDLVAIDSLLRKHGYSRVLEGVSAWDAWYLGEL